MVANLRNALFSVLTSANKIQMVYIAVVALISILIFFFIY